MKNYIKENDPFLVPTNDLKLIEEHFGNASNKHPHCSIARIEIPPRWIDSNQTQDFDEFILLEIGRLLIWIDNEEVELNAGETFLTKKGAYFRYDNPFDFPAKYWSVCVPPFSLDKVKCKK